MKKVHIDSNGQWSMQDDKPLEKKRWLNKLLETLSKAVGDKKGVDGQIRPPDDTSNTGSIDYNPLSPRGGKSKSIQDLISEGKLIDRNPESYKDKLDRLSKNVDDKKRGSGRELSDHIISYDADKHGKDLRDEVFKKGYHNLDHDQMVDLTIRNAKVKNMKEFNEKYGDDKTRELQHNHTVANLYMFDTAQGGSEDDLEHYHLIEEMDGMNHHENTTYPEYNKTDKRVVDHLHKKMHDHLNKSPDHTDYDDMDDWRKDMTEHNKDTDKHDDALKRSYGERNFRELKHRIKSGTYGKL